MGKLKDRLYYFLVEKNPKIKAEYQGYVNSHQKEHAKKRGKSWRFLLRLNWRYRILRRKKPLFTTDTAAPQFPLGVKLPYMYGPESEGLARESTVEFVSELLPYDVISFDIFDTLLLRPFANPTDLFILLGKKFGMMNFHFIRTEAEREARADKMAKDGNAEINIYDIYEKISRRTSLDVEIGVRTELELEKDFCFANPYMMQVYKMLKEQGKKVVITSDMYIPHDMMTELLASAGYEGYDKLYVSCDYGCSKASTGLYKTLMHENDGCSVIHVGDNYFSDFEMAKKCGLNAKHYQNCHEMGNPYRADGMSDLVGSMYAGIINTHLHNGTKTFNPYYEYGYVYGGLYIVGFCNWIYRKAKLEGVEKILFLARDGDIYQKVFSEMFDDMPSEYVFWSRIANTKYTIENSKDDVLTRMVAHKKYDAIPSTYQDILESFDLARLIPNLKKAKLKPDTLLVPESAKKFENFLIDNWEEIKEAYREETDVAERAMRRIIGGCKKVAVIDVGWIGSGPMGIKYLAEKKWKLGCEVKCYMAASLHPITNLNANELLDETTESYIFSRMYNRDLFDGHLLTNKGTNNIFFELLTQACTPSFSGYSADGGYTFDVPEVKNYAMTKEIQKGIMDFAKQFLHYTRNFSYMRNISGHDAYMPFRFAIRDVRFVKNIFNNASFSMGVGVSKKQAQDTITDIFDNVGL